MPPKDDTQIDLDETVFKYGGALKSLGEGKVGGYLVLFSGPGDPDLTGDFFTKDTDFGDAVETDLYYQHGRDSRLKRRKLSEGKATLKKDDVGIWIEAQLALRDEYEEYILDQSRKGREGLSSGTLGHLVERELMGKAYWIKSWPLGLDGSITPTPAEPRTSITPIKSIEVTTLDPAKDGSTVSPAERETTNPEPPAKGLTDMPPELTAESIAALVTTTLEKRDAERKALEATEAKAKADTAKLIADAIEIERKKWEAEAKHMSRRGGAATPDATDDGPALYQAVKNTGFFRQRENFWRSSQVNRDVAKAMKGYIRKQISDGELEDALKAEAKASNNTDMNIATPADGGYAVPVGHYQGIIAKCDEGAIDVKLGVMDIPGKGTTVNVPAESGSANEFVSTAETVAFDIDAPVLTQLPMTLVKYTKDIILSDELLEDEDSKLMAFLDNYVGRALARTYNHLLVTALAAGATATALGGASTVAAGDIPGLSYALKDCYADNAKWLMRRATEGVIRALSGNPYLFFPSPQGGPNNLWGYPIFNSEFVAAPAASAKSVYFGDFSYVGKRGGTLSFLRDPYSKASTGQLVLHYYTRTVYKVLLPEAILAGTAPSA